MSATLKLCRAIYRDNTVQEAIEAYQGLADIQLSVSDPYVLVTFSSCRYDEETTVREFENYCIGLENKRQEVSN